MKPSPRALSCPACAGPVAYGTAACTWCASPLEWAGGIPPLEIGEVLCDVDLFREALPEPTRELDSLRTEGGTQIHVKGGESHSGKWTRGLTSCSVQLIGAALEPHGALGVLARLAEAGRMRCSYALIVRPGLRTWKLLTLLWDTRGPVKTKTLRASAFSSAIAGSGQWNLVELRTADTLLEVRINQQVVETIVDGVIGYGVPGWWVEAYGAPATVVLNRFSVRALD